MGHVLGHHEGLIHRDGREGGHVHVVAGRTGRAHEGRHVQLEGHHGRLGPEGVDHERMNLPHPADGRAVGHHLGGAARLQLRGLIGGKRPEAHFGQRQLAGQVLQHALGVEEVEGHCR